jgi:vesicle coat complex subunit
MFICENDLRATSAEELARAISAHELDDSCLTFAAEILGQIDTEHAYFPVLVELLHHEKAYVREGAVYGLWNHCQDETSGTAWYVRDCLREVSIADLSPEVCAVAREALE